MSVEEISLECVGPQPDRLLRVSVPGGKVVAYVYGEGQPETILAINGGPGVASEYLRRGLQPLVQRGYRVVIHDQLGTGASDIPDDPSLWTLERYVAEVEAVRAALGGGKVHLLGHSWGGWLGIEYAVTHTDKLKSAIFSSTSANIPIHIEEVRRLLSAFGSETLAMIDRLEESGQLDSPFYQAICTLFYGRHSSRRAYLKGVYKRGTVNAQIQHELWGDTEFRVTSKLKDWNRLPDLARVTVPCLVTVGAYDYLTPRSAGLIHAHLPKARFALFAESGHDPATDEPERYAETVAAFLSSAIALS